MAVSQPATYNESWSDERVFAYLDWQPPTGVNADYHVLYSAYKHMRPHDYERLLQRFVSDGRDITSTNPQGLTLLQVLQTHSAQSQAFIDLLNKYLDISSN